MYRSASVTIQLKSSSGSLSVTLIYKDSECLSACTAPSNNKDTDSIVSVMGVLLLYPILRHLNVFIFLFMISFSHT